MLKRFLSSSGVTAPADAAVRRAVKPVVCYEVDKLPKLEDGLYAAARATMRKVSEVVVPPRDGRTFRVPAGGMFRIVCPEGPQVGDLNLWRSDDLSEKFYASKTRQLQATHLTVGDRLWSSFPYMRPMATITEDTLSWYGSDDFGGGVHDVIGSRCDPYTNAVLRAGADFDYCCHSNLSRALAADEAFKSDEQDPVLRARAAENYVHDVLNVFMCTGFDLSTKKYFMKATPARPGDFLEFFAEIPLLGGLSACPGGDCGSKHSDDAVQCYPLLVEIYDTDFSTNNKTFVPPKPSSYSRTHGLLQNQPHRLPPK